MNQFSDPIFLFSNFAAKSVHFKSNEGFNIQLSFTDWAWTRIARLGFITASNTVQSTISCDEQYYVIYLNIFSQTHNKYIF